MNDVLHVLDCAYKSVTFTFDRACVSEFLTMTAQMIDQDAQFRMVNKAAVIKNFFSIDSLYFYLFCGLLGINLIAIIANKRKR
jgi:hypothetical protein